MNLERSILTDCGASAELVIVAAMDQAYGTGKDGGIPWRLTRDLQRFRALTTGGVLAMGRVTYASCVDTLSKDRAVALLSKTRLPQGEARRVHAVSLKELLFGMTPAKGPLFACGGEGVWSEAIKLSQRGTRTMAALTIVEGRFDCDRRFPVDPCLWGFKEVLRTAWQDDPEGGPRSKFIQLVNW